MGIFLSKDSNLFDFYRKDKDIGVLTAAHCICCFHDDTDICKENYHHCQQNKIDKKTFSEVAVDQIVGRAEYLKAYPRLPEKTDPTRRSDSPFNVVAIVLGSKKFGFRNPQYSHDQVFYASNAYAMSATETNGKINLYVDGKYDIALIKAKVPSVRYSVLKLAHLNLPSMYEEEY